MSGQRSIEKTVSCSGIGLHSGKPVNIRLLPAPKGRGILFIVKEEENHYEINASLENLADTDFSISLRGNGGIVITIEHLLSTLSSMGIDNLYIELDSSEVPIMDGSSLDFINLIRHAGILEQGGIKQYIKIIKEIAISEGEKSISVKPSTYPQITYSIYFDHPAIGSQSYSYYPSEANFINKIAPARTFTLLRDVERLWAKGLAKGGSLKNAVVVGDHDILNEGGLRYKDEFVRHKILDLIGDISLLGAPIIGHITASRSGHALNTRLISEILSRKDCWVWVASDDRIKSKKRSYPLFSTSHMSSNLVD